MFDAGKAPVLLKSASCGRHAVPDEAVELLVVTAGGGGTMFFRASEVELKPPGTRDPQNYHNGWRSSTDNSRGHSCAKQHWQSIKPPPTVLLSCDRPEPERIRSMLGMDALGPNRSLDK